MARRAFSSSSSTLPSTRKLLGGGRRGGGGAGALAGGGGGAGPAGPPLPCVKNQNAPAATPAAVSAAPISTIQDLPARSSSGDCGSDRRRKAPMENWLC